jgi:plastocyanin
MRMPGRPSAAVAALAVVVPLPLHMSGHHKTAKHHRKPSAHLSRSRSHAKSARAGARGSNAGAPSAGASAAHVSRTTLHAPARGSAITKMPGSGSNSARHELQSAAGRAAGSRVAAGNSGGGIPGPGSSHTPRTALKQHAERQSRAHAAGDPTDVISDFKFAPGTITVHVGDTITWVNNGPTEHSATANDKSFDTGLLPKDASASHTFTQSGTFAYICKIHPFMHGTVVVLASTTTTPSTGSASSSSSAPASGASASSPSTATPASATSNANGLPVTGFDAAASLLSGLGLLGIGYVVRGRTRRAQ